MGAIVNGIVRLFIGEISNRTVDGVYKKQIITKGLLTSKATLGVLISVVGWAANRYGLDMGAPEVQAIATDLLVAGGALFAIYGRITASKPMFKG